MSDGTIEVTSAEPVVLHQGKYRLYKNPDGGLYLIYQRDDKDTPDSMQLPGGLMELAQRASEGKISPMQIIMEVGKIMKGSM